MKLIDEKLVNEALDKAYNIAGVNAYFASGFNMGTDFAEQQLKQKMIEFADWCSWNGWNKILRTGSNEWIHTLGTLKTSEQLLEEFINQQK